jgi:putative tricarboxylic transport membrane protein
MLSLRPKSKAQLGGNVGNIRNPKDFWAGVLFITVGVAAIALGSRYNLGTAARMGPGYFPRILGIMLIVLGAILALRGLRLQGAPIPAFKWRPTLIVLGSVVLFGMLVTKIGMAISVVILIVLSSSASPEFRPKEALISGVLLAALAVGVFVIGLKLQVPIWPTFLQG